MTAFPCLAAGFILKFVAVLFVIVSIALILMILIQKGRGGGLSGAFGGAMASGVLGSKTGDFLTWVTIVLVGVFLFLAIILAKYYKPTVGDYGSVTSNQQQTVTGTEEAIPESSVTQTDTSGGMASETTVQQDVPAADQENTLVDSIDSEVGRVIEGSDSNTLDN